MSSNRRVLSLSKTPAQSATERHEDALMQKVAQEDGTEQAQRKPVTFAGESPPEGESPKLDEAVPYAIVSGEPGVAFVQGRNFYDRAKCCVREAPMAQWYFSDVTVRKVSAMEAADAARSELLARGLLEGVPRLPQKLLEAERENASAAAAESLAE